MPSSPQSNDGGFYQAFALKFDSKHATKADCRKIRCFSKIGKEYASFEKTKKGENRLYTMILADRLHLADDIQAVLWDMDGVLLDTLGLDVVVCNQLVKKYFGDRVDLSREYIRSIFAYHPPEFWRIILDFVKERFRVGEAPFYLDEMLLQYLEVRNNAVFEANPGIVEILKSAKEKGVKCAVVSNNLTEDIVQIVEQAGLSGYFDLIVGNDLGKLAKKPAPDTYLYAAKTLNVSPEKCAVVEDSLLGAEAGRMAGCFTVGVCTGSADFKDLESCPFTDRVYTSFEPAKIFLEFGPVTRKRISTPNDFVSHMAEHVAWRLGCAIDLSFPSNDWKLLGKRLGETIRAFRPVKPRAAALGMIDDGSAEALIDLESPSELRLESGVMQKLDWFLSLRCEQLTDGTPLVEMLEGLSEGLNALVAIRICNVEDPHHAWEGIFRSVGIALNGIFQEKSEPVSSTKTPPPAENGVSSGDVTVAASSPDYAKVVRRTAESVTSVTVDFARRIPNACRYEVSGSIEIDKLSEPIFLLADAAGFAIDVDFNASVLSSSHVAAEDTALVLGRALKEILVLRMKEYGVHGAGSSIREPDDFYDQSVRVGVSVEGRKFWKLVPLNDSLENLRKKFIIGQTVCGELFSEDLDDFLDGLSGGLGCGILVHFKDIPDPDSGWKMLFENLGAALKTAFEPNPNRKGVPPGVKATLA